MVMGQATVAALQCLNLLLVTKLDDTGLIGVKLYRESACLRSRLFRTWAFFLNFRGVGTTWEARNVPYHAAYLQQNSTGQTLSRKRYILREIAIIIWQYLLIDLIEMGMKNTTHEDRTHLFGPGLEYRYFDATFEQYILSRAYFLILVIFGIASPESCRPAFGRMSEAYSVRGFWGKFWHQSLRWPFTSVSNYITRDVLRLPRPSILERYANISFTFFMSGVFHLVCNATQGIPPSESGAVKFFCSFPLAIIIEDGVEVIWHRLAGQDKVDIQPVQPVPFWQRLIGFLWVGVWMCVTSPWYLYPAARQRPDKDWLVPFSFIKAIGLVAVQATLVLYGIFLYFAIGGEI
ncbi:Acetyltransferase pyr8 [Penicillium rubens]|uniref:Acetyltransferase pyr8 n=1 Tax=Penicillium chrysogenum TaxID=5076 RepID=A0ABQ8WE64_PENCH|nr:Acetyltransferase pyr8 [Penicillium chrysogenum]KAJ5849320.1 Acetyltransferase pyr8 [Penicillium rubens]